MTDPEMAQQARINIDLARRLSDPTIAGDRQNEPTTLTPKVATEIVNALLNSGNCLQFITDQRLKAARG